MWALRAAACLACCFVAARWGAQVERRRTEAVGRSPDFQGRGELWLRCPASSTWYEYAGDPREWRTVTLDGEVMMDERSPR